MLKKIVCLVMSALMLTGTTTLAFEKQELPVGYYNILYSNRYMFFATDGGSFIRHLQLPRGTTVSLDEYVPTKVGYVFDGWYLNPKAEGEKVSEIKLDENTVVWARWKPEGNVSVQSSEQGVISREVVGNTVVIETQTATLAAPVTDLWLAQNARLNELMKLYDQKFNK